MFIDIKCLVKDTKCLVKDIKCLLKQTCKHGGTGVQGLVQM